MHFSRRCSAKEDTGGGSLKKFRMHFGQLIKHYLHLKLLCYIKLQIHDQLYFKSDALTKQTAVVPFMVNIVFLRKLRTLNFYAGKTSGIRCKRESDAPALEDFVTVLGEFSSYQSKLIKIIKIVTDDATIFQEIKSLKHMDYTIAEPDPAPKRILDKVCWLISSNFLRHIIYFFCRKRRAGYSTNGLKTML